MTSSSSSRSKAYTQAGVNIASGEALVSRIKKMVGVTHIPGVMSDIGGFGGLFKPDLSNTENPVLVAATDGVGTKLKMAFLWDIHNTIGIDLVAMSVNDVLAQGAKPLFFLDYFATGALDVDKAEQVIAGVVEGCRQSGCALLGGETAEMPDMYQPGEYDLAGFCVGLVSNHEITNGSQVKVNDTIIGLASSGPHANGYSLIRRLFEKSGCEGTSLLPGTTQTLQEALLMPTRIYVESIKAITRDTPINSMAHITGGGFYENIPRALPAPVQASIQFGSWPVPPVFNWIKEQGNLTWPEMLQIFNCGIGYVLIVSPSLADDIINRLDAINVPAWKIGTVKKADENQTERISIRFDD